MTTKYQEQVPPPMNRQFPERASKDEAIKNKESRKRTWTQLFPPGELNIYHCPYSIRDALLLYPISTPYPSHSSTHHHQESKNVRSLVANMLLLYCLEAEQNSMETTSGAQQATATEPSNVPVEPPAKKRAPSCRKCHQPMRGHPRNKCPVPTATHETSNN